MKETNTNLETAMTEQELLDEIRDIEGLRKWGDLDEEQLERLEALYESLDEGEETNESN